MSLIAWYPLNGNLKDYSGNYSDLTGNWTIDNNGKIGKCYKKSGDLRFPFSHKDIGSCISLSFWIYVDSSVSETSILFGVDSPRAFLTCFQYPTKNDLHWSTPFEGETTNQGGVDNGVLKDNSWTHVTIIYNNRKFHRYYNGELKGISTFNNDLRFNDTVNCILRGVTGTKINDLRVYNHELSTKEIKEIIKCETVHYNFNECLESTTNICGFDGDFESFTLNDSAGFTSQLGTGSTLKISSEIVYTGNQSLKISQTTGNSGRVFRTVSLNQGDIATFSAWVYSIKAGSTLRIELNGGGHTWTGFSSTTHKGTGWEKLSVTTTAALGVTTLHAFIYPTDNNTIYIDNFLIEKKNHASSFTNGTNLISVSDSSGYNNHSKAIPINLCPTWTNDSIFGNGCYNFTGNNKIESNSSFFSSTSVSLSVWVKPKSRQTTNDRDIICQLITPASCYITLTSDGYMSCYNYSVTPSGYHNTSQIIPLNEWSHLVATWDSTKLRMYINGKMVKEVTHTLNSSPIVSTCLSLGCDNNNRYYNGLLDDVRVFQSTLTDSEIEQLYNTKVSISNTNNLYINEIIESPNLFNPTTILNTQKRLGFNTSSLLKTHTNIETLALSASSYYNNSTYYSIFPENYFEPNTSYDFCITINSNLIHNGGEVPGGIRIRYSDNTYNDTFVVKTSGKWKQYHFRSDVTKTISKIEVYYYIGALFYIDPSTSYIKKVSNININNKGQGFCHDFRESNYSPGLLDYSTWSLTGAPGWALNGLASENDRIIYGNPKKDLDIMWYVPLNDTTSDADGGFVSPKVEIDKTKKYRFSIWIRRENCGTGSGTTYFGLYGYNSAGTNSGVLALANSAVNTNAYFKSTAAFQEIMENWILFVSYIYPNTTTVTTSDSTSGLYTLNGQKVQSSTDFKWNTDTTHASLRSYLYYSTKVDEKQYFYRPRIDLCNGSEPTINELLTCNEHLPLVNPNGEYYPINTFSMYNNRKILTNQIFEK